VVRSEPSCWWIPQLQQKKPVQRKILDSRGRSFCCCNQGHQKGLGSVCPLQSSLMAPIYEMFSVLSLRIAHVLTHTIYLFAQMTCSYLVDKSFMLIPLYKYAEPPPPHLSRVHCDCDIHHASAVAVHLHSSSEAAAQLLMHNLTCVHSPCVQNRPHDCARLQYRVHRHSVSASLHALTGPHARPGLTHTPTQSARAGPACSRPRPRRPAHARTSSDDGHPSEAQRRPGHPSEAQRRPARHASATATHASRGARAAA